MAGKGRYLALAGLLGVLTLGLTGCQVTGGGWLTSILTGNKATFSLNGTLTNDWYAVQGEYQDQYRGQGLRAHLTAFSTDSEPECLTEEDFFLFEELVFFCLDELGVELDEEHATIFAGTYRPQPSTAGPGGCFIVFTQDRGTPGSNPGDIFAIAFFGGIYDGYVNCGTLGGGNLQVEGGLGCFTAGTRITMADGSQKPIEQIEVGEQVLGPDGEVNRVVSIERPLLGARKLYALNGGEPFVTASHPFKTQDGWKSIDPAATAKENSQLTVGTLKSGDVLVTGHAMKATAAPLSGAQTKPTAGRLVSIPLERLEGRSADPTTQLYNLRLDGSHVYFANGYLVHNK